MLAPCRTLSGPEKSVGMCPAGELQNPLEEVLCCERLNHSATSASGLAVLRHQQQFFTVNRYHQLNLKKRIEAAGAQNIKQDIRVNRSVLHQHHNQRHFPVLLLHQYTKRGGRARTSSLARVIFPVILQSCRIMRTQHHTNEMRWSGEI